MISSAKLSGLLDFIRDGINYDLTRLMGFMLFSRALAGGELSNCSFIDMQEVVSLRMRKDVGDLILLYMRFWGQVVQNM